MVRRKRRQYTIDWMMRHWPTNVWLWSGWMYEQWTRAYNRRSK